PALELLRQHAREDGGQREETPLIGIQRVQRLELFVERLVVGARHRVLPARLDQDPDERKQELEVCWRRRQTERINRESGPIQRDVQRAAAEVRGEALVAPAEVKDQRAGAVALQMRNQE